MGKPIETHEMTVKQIQQIIHFFTDAKINSFQIKGYFKVLESKLQSQSKG